ncbi:hypothetical protein Cgig2_001527 [Carnegiea gigantea]|uniref:Protein kinase domain-containing protein n=1 Tax=Carnegiea gigantea TaxID=171969 RepID=A0A9Q1KW23_9CARY|nr:hypothetical protein Cgig2_001527 [Carnegiea gigantea]
MEAENGDMLKSKMEDYEVIEQIGKGAFGSTFLILHKAEQKKYVLKKIRLAKQTEKFKQTACQEMSLISKLKHPYIVEYKDSWVDEEYYVCLVTSYCEGGQKALGWPEELFSLRRYGTSLFHKTQRVCKWMVQMLLALDYLHSNRVLHRNLKVSVCECIFCSPDSICFHCSNILFSKENGIQLGDFGLAKLLSPDGIASLVAATPNFMCPEVLANMPHGYKSDIWSLGKQCGWMILKLWFTVVDAEFVVGSGCCMRQIIKNMLRKAPEHRPTAAELLRHPHLQPYVVRCRVASPACLPIRSPNSKEKTPTRLSPGKPIRGKDETEKDPRAVKLIGNFDHCDRTSDEIPTIQQNCDKSAASAASDENLETKRVDPVSYLKLNGSEEVVSNNKSEVEQETHNDGSSQKQGNGENEGVNPTPSDLSLLRRLSELACDQTKGGVEVAEPQRADALESLLELCARLLREDKLDELAGVLRPFGEEAVSSRETAIWLTKSLMAAHKSARGNQV